VSLFEKLGALWKKTKPLSIRNEYDSFELLNKAIWTRVHATAEVIIGIDHTGARKPVTGSLTT